MASETVRPKVIDQPVFFPPDDQTYFGIVSTPPEDRRCTTGVVLLSGTHNGSTTMGRNRMWVMVARELAGLGFTTLRLDYAGLGESLPGGPIYDLEQPAVDAFEKGVAHLRSLGMDRFIVVGTCFGSRTAINAAAGEADVSGVLLLAPPVRNNEKGAGGSTHLAVYATTGDLAKRALTKRSLRKLVATRQAREMARRVLAGKVRHVVGGGIADQNGERVRVSEAAEGFVAPLRTLAQRGTPVRIVYGTSDMFYTEFERATEGRLGQIIDRAGDKIEVVTVAGVVRGFTSLQIQEASTHQIVDWVTTCG